MMSDFYAGILVAWQLDGVKFALGPTIATTRARLTGFGGFRASKTAPPTIYWWAASSPSRAMKWCFCATRSKRLPIINRLRELLHKRLRWIVVMRHMRPWGHLGLLLTQGLPWSLAAVAVHPSAEVALGYLGTCLVRFAMTWIIGIHGLVYRQTSSCGSKCRSSQCGMQWRSHLADQLRAQQHPLAWGGLLHPGWAAGPRVSASSRRIRRARGSILLRQENHAAQH